MSQNAPQDVAEGSSSSQTITHVTDFLEWSEKCSRNFGIRSSTTWPWFRGHSDASWKLIPSIYRKGNNAEFEREMIRDFKASALEFLDPHERNSVDWLFLAQHHGVPTRLLDWTANPLIALYFACESMDLNCDGEVHAMNAWQLNIANLGVQSVPQSDSNLLRDYVIDISSQDFEREVKAELPIAVRPHQGFRRLNAQQGFFTLHGTKIQSVDNSKFVKRNRSSCTDSVKIPGNRKNTC